MELQDLKKGKEVQSGLHPEVWCKKCKVVGQYKDHFPMYWDYIAVGGPNPLKLESLTRSSASSSFWCSIYQVS